MEGGGLGRLCLGGEVGQKRDSLHPMEQARCTIISSSDSAQHREAGRALKGCNQFLLVRKLLENTKESTSKHGDRPVSFTTGQVQPESDCCSRPGENRQGSHHRVVVQDELLTAKSPQSHRPGWQQKQSNWVCWTPTNSLCTRLQSPPKRVSPQASTATPVP